MADDDQPIAFSSHLEELRWRMIWTLAFFVLALSVAFAYGVDPLVRYIQELAVVTNPVTGQVSRIKFTVIDPLETFSTTMTVSFYIAVAVTYPWAMFQVWRFVAPGLYAHERRFALFLFPAIFLLFFAGAAFGRYVLLTFSIPFLLGFNVQNFEVQPAYTLKAFLSLIFAMTFGLGLIFQLPLLVAPLIRFNIVSPDFFAKKRKHIIVLAVILGAVISPTGSPIDMFVAAAPVFFLVEGGVLLGRFWRNRALKRATRMAEAAQARGEPVDLENLAGGLAVDLEAKLKEMSGGGARKLARELFVGVREAGKAWSEEMAEGAAEANTEDVKSLFDDDHKDSDRPPVPVKLKRKTEREASASGTNQGLATTPLPAPQPAPDAPWQEGVDEQLARYIDDRISCRIDEAMQNRIQPLIKQTLAEWGEKFKQELRDHNGNGHG